MAAQLRVSEMTIRRDLTRLVAAGLVPGDVLLKFGGSIDVLIATDRPVPDAQMYLDVYRDADPKEDFGHFEDQRKTNIELLRGLPAETGSRKGLHRSAGEITLSQMLHEWVLHDIGHIRQIAELVRARKYLAGAGPLGEDYQLKP